MNAIQAAADRLRKHHAAKCMTASPYWRELWRGGGWLEAEKRRIDERVLAEAYLELTKETE